MTRAVIASVVFVTALTAATSSAQPAPTPARKLDIARHGCDYVSRMVFSQDGSVLAVAGKAPTDEQVLQLWSVADGRHLQTLRGVEANERFALSPDGKVLAVPSHGVGPISADAEVVLWDVPRGKELRRLKHPYACVVSFSPVGNVLASISFQAGSDLERNDLRVWDTATGQQLYATASEPIIHTAFAADGRLLFWGYDWRLRCWDPVTRKERTPVVIPPDTEGPFTPLPSGNEVLAVDSKSGRIRLHDATSLKVLRGFGEGKEGLFSTTDAMFAPGGIDPTDLKDHVASDAFTHDGKRLVVALDSGRVEVWDTSTGKRLSSFNGPKRGYGFALPEVLPDGKHVMLREFLVGGDGSGLFKGRSVYTFDGRPVRREPDVRDVRFDPSGRSVAVVSWTPDNGDRPREHTVSIFDAASWLVGGAKKD